MNDRLVELFHEAIDCSKENKEILREQIAQLDKYLQRKKISQLTVKQKNHLIFRTVLLGDRIDKMLNGLAKSLIVDAKHDEYLANHFKKASEVDCS